MAATLSLDTLTSAGAGITVATGKTLTVGGKSVTAGSSNIQRATSDVTVATTADYGVAGKSELVIAANAGGATRTITLCPVAETGADTCIITVVADANATSTYKLMVVESDGTTEVWTGYQTGDFVRLIVNNGAWLVVDHKETYYSYFYVTAASTGVSPGALTKITGWTEVTDIGNAWDNANNKIVTPTDMNGYWTIYFLLTKAGGTENDMTPQLYLNGVIVSQSCLVQDTTGAGMAGSVGLSGQYYATSTQAVEFYGQSQRTNAYGYHSWGGAVKGATHFVARFNRVY